MGFIRALLPGNRETLGTASRGLLFAVMTPKIVGALLVVVIVVCVLNLFVPEEWRGLLHAIFIVALAATITYRAFRHWRRKKLQYHWPRHERMFFVLVVSASYAFLVFPLLGVSFINSACTVFAVMLPTLVALYLPPVVALFRREGNQMDRPTKRLHGVLTSPRKLNLYLLEAGLSTERTDTFAARRLARPTTLDSTGALVRSRTAVGAITKKGVRHFVPELRHLEVTNAGIKATLTMLRPLTLGDYQGAEVRLATALQIKRVSFYESTADRERGLIQMRLMISDPLQKTMEYPVDLTASILETQSSSYKSIPFGMDEEGEIASIGVIESNMIVGGVPGGGKSGGLTAIITGLAMMPGVALVGLDPKMVEQAPWASRFSRIATKLPDALSVLRDLTSEMDRRYEEELVAVGKKKISADMISPDLPLIAVVADEMAELVAMGSTKEEKQEDQDRINAIQRLIQKGRAAGIVFIGATQKPAAETIPTRLRDLVQQRAAYATTNSFMTDTILGTGMSSAGGLAHEIAHEEKGVCYLVNESSRTPVKVRTFWIPDEDAAGIAARTAHLRVELPWIRKEGEVFEGDGKFDEDRLPAGIDLEA